MKKIRIILALLFFSGISLLLTGLVPGAFRWLGWMPKLQFLPAVMGLSILAIAIVLALTILFGRIYCSTICPLGVMQDGISHVSVLAKRARKNRRPFRYRKELKWLRYGIWLLFVLALVFGLQSAVAVLAPYSAYGRIFSSIMHFQPGAVLIAAVATLLLTGILAWFTGREYCNVICPVGTTLSFFSRFAIFRPVIDGQKCKNCKVCENNCKAGCIDIANHKIDYSRCVDCFDCIGNCKFDALHLKNYYKKSSLRTAEDGSSSVNPRRAFIAGAAMGLTAVTLGAQNKKKDGGYALVEDKQTLDRETPITPPGSVSIKDFYHRCTACQLCIAACPNGVLRPSTGIEHLMQPEMGFEKGY
jgi:polyferredoxin